MLVKDADGSISIRIALFLSLPVYKYSDTLFYETRYRRAAPDTEWVFVPLVNVTSKEVSVYDVESGISYELSLRTITETGYASDWTSPVLHHVVGKLTPPPDVSDFIVAREPDGTRIFSWDYPNPPRDLAGFRIRYAQQGNASRVLSYQYRQRLSGGSWGSWTTIPSSGRNEDHEERYTITGLTADQEYEFQVRTVLLNNEFGGSSVTVSATPT